MWPVICPDEKTRYLWGGQVTERRGKLVANVAMSRKLGGIMYAIWWDP